MQDYNKLVEALRCGEYKPECGASDCPYWSGLGCMGGQLVTDAADAIEALNHLVDLNTERCEGLRKQLREAQENYEKHLNELEAQMPKRGKWIRIDKHTIQCPLCHMYLDLRGVNAGRGDANYCPNCGAKMEVRE